MLKLPDFTGAVFDLDGVLVDTVRYHFLAWRRLAENLGFLFTERDNERLKGVSRMRSLEILLEVGGLNLPEEEKERLAAQKNAWYVESLNTLSEKDLLPGALDYLRSCRAEGKKIALGSASKNAPLILERLGIATLFDVIIDGTRVSSAKPDPEVFAVAVQELGLSPAECLVFEDALAGIEAAHAAGCRAVAVGDPNQLPGAEWYVRNLGDLLEQNPNKGDNQI